MAWALLQAVAHCASAMNTAESSSAGILPGISRSGTLCSLSFFHQPFPIEHKAHPLPPHLRPMAEQRPLPPPPPPTFSLALNSPPPPFFFHLLLRHPLLSHRLAQPSVLVSHSRCRRASGVWSSDRSSLACQISRLTSVILRKGGGPRTIHALSLSLFFLPSDSLVTRLSHVVIRDLRLGLYGSVERNILLCALVCCLSRYRSAKVPNEISNAAWLITRFFFSFTSLVFLFLSQIESLSRRVFRQ